MLLPAAGVLAEGWHDLPPDERREMRRQMREQWVRERYGNERPLPPPPGHADRPDWRSLPPDERQRLKDEMRRLHRERIEAGDERGRGERPPPPLRRRDD